MFCLKPEMFDIVYVDGSHRACHALRDIVISFELLKDGGLMIIDDYAWKAYPDDPMLNPGPAIDAFLTIYAPRINLLHKEYQVIVKKCSLTDYSKPAS
jgi:predicted O-methyltransferase YrrM